jgi:hypothetical protein
MRLRFPLGGYTKAANDTSAQLESGFWFCNQKEAREPSNLEIAPDAEPLSCARRP